MPFQYLTNTPLEEAQTIWQRFLLERGLAFKTEQVAVRDALDRITSKAVYAHISSPHYNACAMDGIALKSALTFGATETTPVRLSSADFTWVDTGDPLPAGCDAVVMVEDVVEDGDAFVLYSAAVPWQNIRQIGEDLSAGDMVIPSFTRVSPACMGALLAGGVLQIEVVTRPLVGIIPTGDEIVSPSDNPRPGDIIEFNSAIFSGMLAEWGCVPHVYPVVKDELPAIKAALEQAATECDAVIINAGSSAGREDFTIDAIRQVGEVALHGIAIKPGKPAILAAIKKPQGCLPLLGVPGYPVSGILVLETLLKPVIKLLTMRQYPEPQWTDAVLSRRLSSSLKHLEFVRARLGNVSGKLVAVPLNRGAGVITSFVKADGMIEIPQNTEGYEADETVKLRLINTPEQIRDALVVTGSHDPLLDEAADLLRRQWPESSVSSSHVGSMGAIMALKRREAHLGGIHLLDEATGEYNAPYLRRYFPDGGVALVECVERVQGLIVAPGNPKGIQDMRSLVGLDFVNRQKGSGTRILCDFLLKQQGIDPSSVAGYAREEYTHTAVAAAIAAGTADAGLGIFSAAKMYDLGFVPIASEAYDLLVAEDALALPAVQRFLNVLTSAEFRDRLNAMGGYTIKEPGRIKSWR